MKGSVEAQDIGLGHHSLGRREEAPSVFVVPSLQTSPGKGWPLSSAAHQGGRGVRGQGSGGNNRRPYALLIAL